MSTTTVNNLTPSSFTGMLSMGDFWYAKIKAGDQVYFRDPVTLIPELRTVRGSTKNTIKAGGHTFNRKTGRAETCGMVRTITAYVAA